MLGVRDLSKSHLVCRLLVNPDYASRLWMRHTLLRWPVVTQSDAFRALLTMNGPKRFYRIRVASEQPPLPIDPANFFILLEIRNTRKILVHSSIHEGVNVFRSGSKELRFSTETSPIKCECPDALFPSLANPLRMRVFVLRKADLAIATLFFDAPWAHEKYNAGGYAFGQPQQGHDLYAPAGRFFKASPDLCGNLPCETYSGGVHSPLDFCMELGEDLSGVPQVIRDEIKDSEQVMTMLDAVDDDAHPMLLRMKSSVEIGRRIDFPNRPYQPDEDMTSVSVLDGNLPTVSVLEGNVVLVREFRVTIICQIRMADSFHDLMFSHVTVADVLERMTNHLVFRG